VLQAGVISTATSNSTSPSTTFACIWTRPFPGRCPVWGTVLPATCFPSTGCTGKANTFPVVAILLLLIRNTRSLVLSLATGCAADHAAGHVAGPTANGHQYMHLNSVCSTANGGSHKAGVFHLLCLDLVTDVQVNPNAIFVSKRQEGNPVLKHIRNVRWQFADIIPDYQLGQNACAVFLSLRYVALSLTLYSTVNSLCCWDPATRGQQTRLSPSPLTHEYPQARCLKQHTIQRLFGLHSKL